MIHPVNHTSQPRSAFIIAEAGVNHNGSLELAHQLIDVAKEAGADAVKFQTFIAEDLLCKQAQKANYQKRATGESQSQLEMIKALELSFDHFKILKNYCDQKNILFLSTPFDFKSISFLQELGLEIFKIPSGEATNFPYLERIGGLKKKVILSTGMCTMEEIGEALHVLQQAGTPKDQITVLQCNTAYPTPCQDVNLKAMQTIQQKFQVDVGYSDHSLGLHIPLAAVALGATIIEKHFTLDKNLPGPDHQASLSPQELKEMVRCIREVEAALGDGIKAPRPSEKENIPIARKSIVAKMPIRQGEILSVDNITVKRPGNGLSPMRWRDILGKTADGNYAPDDLIISPQ